MKTKVFVIDITNKKDVIFTREHITNRSDEMTVTGYHIQSKATITRLNDLMARYESRIGFFCEKLSVSIYNELKGL